MKSIFFLTTHIGALQSFASAVQGLDVRILVPGKTLQKHLHYGSFDVSPSTLSSIGIELGVIEEEEYFGSPPDMLVCTHPFTQEVMYNHAVRMREIKHVVLCCYTQGFSVPHDFRYFDALIAVDYPSYVRAQTYGIPSIYYWPWIDFQFWSSPHTENDNVCIRMFCNSLEQRPSPLPEMFKEISESYPIGTVENYEWLPSAEVRRLLHEASATLSIKPNEGYGYSVIESLACGRPIFAYRPLIGYQTYVNWLIEDKTCVFFDSVDEFKNKFEIFCDDAKWRRELQKGCADLIREIIDNDQQNLQMKRFIRSLIENRPCFSPYIPDTDLFRTEFLHKREMWNILSNKMWWDPIAKLKDILDYQSDYGIMFNTNKFTPGFDISEKKTLSTDEFRLVPGRYEIGVLKQNNIHADFHFSFRLKKGADVLFFESYIPKSLPSWVGIVANIKSDDEPLSFEARPQSEGILPWIFIRPLLTADSM